jgi:hypothetical protein
MGAGTAYILHEEISASQLITMGLDFEQQQYVNNIFSQRFDAYSGRRRLDVDLRSLGPQSTDEQKTRLQNRCNVLRRKVTSWINVQHLYMPGLHVLHTRDDQSLQSNEQEEEVAKVKLYLPSSVTSTAVVCDVRLRRIEWDLRQAQAHDALHELRDGLRLRSYVYIDKDRFQRGQRHNTRSRGLINRLEMKVDAAAAKYRVARQSINTLASSLGHVGWEINFPILNDSDIIGLSDMSSPEYYKMSHTSRHSQDGVSGGSRLSEGHRDVSWIWKHLGSIENTDEQLQDGPYLALSSRTLIDTITPDLRIEFCKSKARADRWAEEVELLQEEMKRVKHFFKTRMEQWQSKAAAVSETLGVSPVMAEGLRAFASEQALQYSAMRAHCEHLWRHVAEYIALGTGDVVPLSEQDIDDDIDVVVS